MRAVSLVTKGMISALCACPRDPTTAVIKDIEEKPRIEVVVTSFESEDIESCAVGAIEVIDVKVNGNGDNHS